MTPVGVIQRQGPAKADDHKISASSMPRGVSLTNRSDLDLLAGFLAGQSNAFDELFVRLTPTVHKNVANAFIRNHLRPSRDDVQETVQSVWASVCGRDYDVLRRFDPTHPQASLRAYVGRFALWRAIDLVRGRRRIEYEAHDSIDFERCTALVDRFSEHVESRDYALTLFSMLYTELRPKGRVALTVLFVEGLSVPEAVRRTGLTESALQTWRRDIRRLARKIRTRLEKESSHA